MEDKKGVSIAFNTIIIGVIALLVLVVIVFMLMNGVKDQERGTACFNAGGRCVEASADCDHPLQNQYDAKGKPLCEPGVCCSIVPAG